MSRLGWAAWLKSFSSSLLEVITSWLDWSVFASYCYKKKEKGSRAPTLNLIHTSGAVDSGGGIHSSTGLC